MKWTTAFAVLSLVITATGARALETDQFTVPKAPLPDLGPVLDLKVDVGLRQLMLEANAHLAKGGRDAKAYLSNDFFAGGLADLYTHGVPECTIERWVRREDFGRSDDRFDVGIGDSVYGGALIGRPLTLFTLAPTINLHGHYVGTDKVGHFFQQGYEYYRAFREARGAGKPEKEAVRQAVLKGVAQEQGIYGMFIVDTYSNADLASDLAGLMFYRNLTEALTLPDGVVLPPMLVLREGAGGGKRWELNAAAGDAHTKALVSDHWDESMNPCFYAPMLRKIVAENVKETGKRWVAFHHTSRAAEEKRLEAMRTWHGIHYGHTGYKDVVTIVSHYYGGAAGADPTAVARKP